MGLCREQFSKDTWPVPRKARKWLKKQLARWNRRVAKRNPEDAPKKNRYRGWYW